jgi:quercetin dioxygenase-like cupin family protein
MADATGKTTTKSGAVHHKWDQLAEDAPMPKLTRRRVIGKQAMISRVFLRNGCDIPTHAHENEQIACVISGEARFGVGAEGSPQRQELIVGAGEVLELPANVPHSCFAMEDTLILDIFSPPSQTTGIDRPPRAH